MCWNYEIFLSIHTELCCIADYPHTTCIIPKLETLGQLEIVLSMGRGRKEERGSQEEERTKTITSHIHVCIFSFPDLHHGPVLDCSQYAIDKKKNWSLGRRDNKANVCL